jgi:predicted transposase YbfD/YdcC
MPLTAPLPSCNQPSSSPLPLDQAPLARLHELFAALPDARVSGRVLHRLPEVLLVALCAMVSDCEDYTDMGIFAQSQLEWLRRFTPLVHGAPSHDVFRNVFMSLKPAALLEVMQQWVGELGGKHLAIDGKVSRGAKDPATGKSSLHLLRAWVGEASLSVGYAACADKSNELEALPRLLASLQLKGTVVTIDAMAGHPQVAQLLHEAGADYVLALKANEKNAFEAVKARFAAARPEFPGTPWPAESWQETVTCEMNRGRYEQRDVVVCLDLAWFDKSWKWPGLQSVVEVRRRTMRQRHTKEHPTEEYHYYLSSLPPDAAPLGKVIRAHWSVENQCHHVLDVTFHEDHCQVRDQTAAQNLTLVREIATKFLKASPGKGTLRSKRKRSALDSHFREGTTNLIFQTFGA